MNDLKYWVAFSRVRRLGTVRFRLLERGFGSMADAWRASPGELKAAGLDAKTVTAIGTTRKTVDPDQEMEWLDKAAVSAFPWSHSDYPSLLKEIPDPPPVLYVKGELLLRDQRSIAVVGTRKATSYGREAALALSTDLAKSGITIVSGLARGIDTIAHHAALDHGGRTVAVLASGVDIIYPRENARLAQAITENGALISEHPLGRRPDAHHFPRRNRLMSGITLGALVIEAGQSSGALWTVRHALEQNREVFCVPGSIFSPASLGVNQLIQQGAKLILSCSDVLEEVNLSFMPNQLEMTVQADAPKPDSAEFALLQQISHDPVHIDAICRGAELPMSVVSSALTLMELKGLVKQVAGMQYIRTREAAAAYAS